MTTSTTATPWYERSFQGRLNILQWVYSYPIRLSRYTNDDAMFGDDDWLRVGSDRPSPAFSFTRWPGDGGLRFTIQGTGEHADKTLGVSRNGYLGLYAIATVEDPWVIEPVAHNQGTLTGRLLDHLGQTIRTTGEEHERFLNIKQGDPVQVGIARV